MQESKAAIGGAMMPWMISRPIITAIGINGNEKEMAMMACTAKPEIGGQTIGTSIHNQKYLASPHKGLAKFLLKPLML